jgi:hypothetical protein
LFDFEIMRHHSLLQAFASGTNIGMLSSLCGQAKP